jgi:hypothetical protein
VFKPTQKDQQLLQAPVTNHDSENGFLLLRIDQYYFYPKGGHCMVAHSL